MSTENGNGSGGQAIGPPAKSETLEEKVDRLLTAVAALTAMVEQGFRVKRRRSPLTTLLSLDKDPKAMQLAGEAVARVSEWPGGRVNLATATGLHIASIKVWSRGMNLSRPETRTKIWLALIEVTSSLAGHGMAELTDWGTLFERECFDVLSALPKQVYPPDFVFSLHTPAPPAIDPADLVF